MTHSHTTTHTHSHRLTATRKLEFCAGHRVLGHEGKCAHFHGHNYELHITAAAMNLDKVGRVIDFSELKRLMKDWIDKHWDHGFILNQNDAVGLDFMRYVSIPDPSSVTLASPQKLYIMRNNPTAENMAEHLLLDICPKLFRGEGIEITHIRLWETPNCYVDVTTEHCPCHHE